jgi:hypothetical protein
MSYQPVLPLGGYAGWRYLNRTLDTQQKAMAKSPPVQRLTDYFRTNIAKAKTADDLVNDRRLLEVALGAFGLKADINSKAFIRRVLGDGTMDRTDLANRLADKRYAALALEFGYGDLGARTGLPGFADKIIARYEKQVFQEAVGAQNNSLRLALNLGDAIKNIADQTSNQNAQWYSMMGNPPLREVFQTALGLPPSFGALDVDRQLVTFKTRAQSAFGTERLSDFTDPAKQEKLIRLFLMRSEAQSSPSGSAILQLLPRR